MLTSRSQSSNTVAGHTSGHAALHRVCMCVHRFNCSNVQTADSSPSPGLAIACHVCIRGAVHVLHEVLGSKHGSQHLQAEWNQSELQRSVHSTCQRAGSISWTLMSTKDQSSTKSGIHSQQTQSRCAPRQSSRQTGILSQPLCSSHATRTGSPVHPPP